MARINIVTAESANPEQQALYDAIRAQLGMILGQTEAWLLMRGMRTLFPRVAWACRSAEMLAERLAALPPQSVRETKALLNRALSGAVDSLLAGALARETESFSEPAFQANLARMLRKKASS